MAWMLSWAGLRLPRGERALLFFLGGGFFLLQFGAFLGQNAGLAVVLERYGASRLPRVYLANALALAALSYLATRVVERLPLRRVLIGAFLVSALAVEAVRWAYARQLWWAPGGLYVTAFVVSDILVVLFWSLAHRVYDTREAKRLFPLVSAAGTLGGALSGFFARAAVAWAPAVVLLDLWAVLLAAGAWWGRAAVGSPVRGGPETDETPHRPGPARAVAPDDRWLSWAIGTGLVGVVTVTLFGRYLYGIALRDACHDDLARLTALNGLLIGLSNLLTLAVQSLLVSRLLSRFGVGVVGLVYPVVMLGAFAALGLYYGLAAAILCFFGITTIRHGVQGVMENVLYTPLPPAVVLRTQMLMTAVGMPLGMVVSGLGLEFLQAGQVEPAAQAGPAALAGLAATGGLLLAAWWRAKAYRAALRHRLRKGGSDLRMRFPALLEEANATVESLLAEGLSPEDPHLLERLRTLVRAGQRSGDRAAAAGGARWDESNPLGRVVEARLRESYRLQAALRRLPRIAVPQGLENLWRGAVRHRLGENLAVILAALRVGTGRADFDRISLRVFDAEPRVRAAAVEMLDELCPESLRPLVLPLLEERRLPEGERAASRRYGETPLADPVAALLEIPDDWLRACTAYAAAQLDPLPYRTQLEALQDSPDRCLSFACRHALARIGRR